MENGTGSWSPNDVDFIRLAYNDNEIRKSFDKAVLGGVSAYHSSATMDVSNDSLKEDYDSVGATVNGRKNNCLADCVGIGTDYTLGVGITQNFVNQDLNSTVESGVNAGKASGGAERNGATTANPLLQQTFIRHIGNFDTRNLVKVI